MVAYISSASLQSSQGASRDNSQIYKCHISSDVVYRENALYAPAYWDILSGKSCHLCSLDSQERNGGCILQQAPLPVAIHSIHSFAYLLGSATWIKEYIMTIPFIPTRQIHRLGSHVGRAIMGTKLFEMSTI